MAIQKEFQQKHGVDCFEKYAPIAKLTTIRTVLVVGLPFKYFSSVGFEECIFVL